MYTRNFPALPSLIAAAVASLGLTVAVPAAEPPTHDHEHSAVTSQSAPTDTRPMEAMQEAMNTMHHMGQGTDQGAMSGSMMQQRMDMMTTVMQMKMDRMSMSSDGPAKPDAPK